MALIMVLVALTILGATTADLVETNEVNLATMVNSRDAEQAEYLARSGVNLARLLLSFQRLLGDTVNFPFWQYADLVIGMFTDSGGGGMLADLAGVNLSAAPGLGLPVEGDLSVKILDEDQKLNVNIANDQGVGNRRERMINQLVALMAPPAYDPLFDAKSEGDRYFQREDIICEIIDYSDGDEELCDKSGGEDKSVYQSMDPPTERKNAPYDSLEELHQAFGVSEDVWSAFMDPDPDDPDARVMTVWGKGRVNVNTAPAQVLFPLVCMMATEPGGVSPCLDPMQQLNLLQILQAIVMIRTFLPFSKESDFIAAIEKPEERIFLPLPGFPIANKTQARYLFTTRSQVFSVYSEATVGQVTKRIHAVIDTENEDMLDPAQSIAAAGGAILYWRME